jgi:hypothetical protein
MKTISFIIGLSGVFVVSSVLAFDLEIATDNISRCGRLSSDSSSWKSAQTVQFQAWTNLILSGSKMELKEECDIYADAACSNKIATETLYVYYEPEVDSFLKKTKDDIQFLKEGQFDVFAWHTLGDYARYITPPVSVALWIRKQQGMKEEVLRVHVFAPGDFVFQHFGRDHIYVNEFKKRLYMGKVSSAIFTVLPWTEDEVSSIHKASMITNLVRDHVWSKGEIPKVSHFHEPGFHEGYLHSELEFPCQKLSNIKIGYVDGKLFDVCFSFCPREQPPLNDGSSNIKNKEVIDLNGLVSKKGGVPDLARFVTFAKETGLSLVYAAKPKKSKVLMSEYFYSNTDGSLQFTAFLNNWNGECSWSLSYYIDFACVKSVRIPSFSRKNGCLVETKGRIVQEEPEELVYELENKELPKIRLICLQKDVSKGIILARRPNEVGEYWLFQNGKLKGIKKYLVDDAFWDDQFVLPSSLRLACPVIGRTGYIALRPDCK